MSARVSIIVPVLNDVEELVGLLGGAASEPGVELLVVNAGPMDEPMRGLARRYPAVRWLEAEAGRATQMNAGAREAAGDWVLFLHADSRLGEGWKAAFDRATRVPGCVGGCFRFRLRSPAAMARVIERGVRLRVSLFGLPYGDQGLFVQREVFRELGGYRPLPLMEDVDLVRRVKRRGRLVCVPAPVESSARRWERDGWLRRSLENMVLVALYFAGVSPLRLARRYYGSQAAAEWEERASHAGHAPR